MTKPMRVKRREAETQPKQWPTLQKKARLPNISAADSLILCEIMAEESCVVGLTKHGHLRHRFTSCITSASKNIWMDIEEAFNLKPEHPRDCLALQKKWDNSVQSTGHCIHGQQKTGGGPCPKSISPITDAVISVIGKQSASIREISEFVDTSMLQINSLSASSPVDNPLSSASIIRRQRVQVGRNDEPEEQSRSSFTATTMPSDVTECFAGNVLSSNYSVVQVVCCQCNCHKQLEILKEEKLRLQIRVLKRQLDEE